MRVLVVGAGGVGPAVARTVARWNLFERVVMADHDEERARRAIAGGGGRFELLNSHGAAWECEERTPARH